MIHRLVNYLHRTSTIKEWILLLAAYETGRRQWVRLTDLVSALDSHGWSGSHCAAVLDTIEGRGWIERQNVVTAGRSGWHSQIRVTAAGAAHLNAAFKASQTPPTSTQPIPA